MLTRLIVRNFKRLDEIDIPLDQNVVLIGPNNSGKTSALQALSLWDSARRAWFGKRGDGELPKERAGVVMNRRDIFSCPAPSARLFWRNLHVSKSAEQNGKRTTKKIRIDVLVDGVTDGRQWRCGFEFDYSNEESIFCRPLREPGYEDEKIKDVKLSEIPEAAKRVDIAYLNAMSGLASRETRYDPGYIHTLIGEGKTAEVLRNLCLQVYNRANGAWDRMRSEIQDMFGVEVLPPEYDPQSGGEIVLRYREKTGQTLDLSSSGRGFQQVLLLLAHIHGNPGCALLLDEPDAHLEILRQRQIYDRICELAAEQNSQIIAASHSEVVLNEAVNRGTVVAFVGRPHVLDRNKTSQARKSLNTLGWEEYYQAESKGWVLYLEGSSDLAILKAFAELLDHPAKEILGSAYVHYLSSNLPRTAREHFYGLQEAFPNLGGIAVFDRLEAPLDANPPLCELMWRKREIENYFCRPSVFRAYARSDMARILGGLFDQPDVREATMRKAIEQTTRSFRDITGMADPWADDVKVSDTFMEPLFRKYAELMEEPLPLVKQHFHRLVRLVTPDEVDADVVEKLNAIRQTADRAPVPD